MHIFLLIIVLISVLPCSGYAQVGSGTDTNQQLQNLQREIEALRERVASLEKDVTTEQEIAAKTLIGGYIQTTYTDFEKQDSNFNIRRLILLWGRKFPNTFGLPVKSSLSLAAHLLKATVLAVQSRVKCCSNKPISTG
jgi:hypothetical protein